jgi:sugar O-acyltransferase (sialic acid O-acetyltransferase NeuD family)
VIEMKHFIIIGIGGFAREVYWHAQGSLGYNEEWDLKGFLDGDIKLAAEEYEKLELPVLGDVHNYEIGIDDVFICAVANPQVKKKLVDIILNRGGKFINLIHKTAIIHGNVKMGIGNLVSPQISIHDHVKLGNFNTFNIVGGVGHDAIIGDYCSFMGGVSVTGYVNIGNLVYFSGGSVALPHSKIEDEAYIGSYSVVFKHVRKGQKVFGNPALPI